MNKLTPQQLSERWHGCISTRTLANWRWKKRGPKFFKDAYHVIYYPLSEVKKYEKQNMFSLFCR